MKLIDPKTSVSIDFDVESFDKDFKFKVSDLLETKYRNICTSQLKINHGHR